MSEIEQNNEDIQHEIISLLNHIEELRDNVVKSRIIEEELRKIHAQTKAILDNIPYLAWLKDLDGKFIYVNKQFAEACGFQITDIIGKTDFDVWPHELAEKYVAVDQEVLESGVQKFVEEMIKDKDKTLWVETFKTPVVDANGRIYGTTGMARDVTERKVAEELLIQAEDKVRTFIESVDDLLYSQALDGTITMMNQATMSLTGYDIEEFEKDPKLWEKIKHPDDLKDFKEFFEKYKEGIPEYNVEYRLITKSGETKWLLSRMIGVTNSAGKIIRYNCIDRDITELKQTESNTNKLNTELEIRVADRSKQLEETLEKLFYENEERKKAQGNLAKAKNELELGLKKEKELSDLKSRFITMVSNNYKTPLTVILTSTHLLDKFFEEKNKEKFAIYIKKINDAVLSMTQMLDEVVTFGKSSSGQLEYKPTNIDLVKLTTHIIDDVKEFNKSPHIVNFISQQNQIL